MNEQRSEELRDRLRALAEAVENGTVSDSACETCRSLLPALVEAELAGESLSDRFPDVWRHLTVCDVCSALYADLLEISMLEEAGELPTPATVPAPDLSFLASRLVRHKARVMAKAILGRMMPESLRDFDLLIELVVERIEAVGPDFRIQSTSELALAFGAEVPPAVPVLAATLTTTRIVLEKLRTPESDREVTRAQLDDLIERVARRQARKMGLSKPEAESFATEYVLVAGEHLVPTSAERDEAEELE